MIRLMETTRDAAAVELLVLDVDGVLTDGRIVLDARGEETKVFHVHDGAGMRCWQDAGHVLAIITGRRSEAVAHRARELGIEHVVQGCPDKGAAIDELCSRLGLEAAQVAVMGDDLPDLPMLRRCGYPMCVADAAVEVREVCAYVTERSGGRGAVREAIEHLLRARGAWTAVVDRVIG